MSVTFEKAKQGAFELNIDLVQVLLVLIWFKFCNLTGLTGCSLIMLEMLCLGEI